MFRWYDPRDWYWIVGGDESRLYASRRRAWVSDDDADYLAFLAAGGAPTRIASEEELRDVLSAAALGFLGQPPPPSLDERVAKLEAENAKLRQALVAKAVVSEAEIAAAGPAKGPA